jgi:methyl-accepting chemotaxis protein
MRLLSLRNILFAIAGLLGLLVIGLALNLTLQMNQQRAIAETGQEINTVSDLLLRSAGSWAAERGMTVAALNGDNVVSSQQRSQINEQRQNADAAFRDALNRLAGQSSAQANTAIREASAALEALSSMRQRVDAALSRPLHERDSTVAAEWVPTATQVIQKTQDLRRYLEYSLDTAEARMAHFQQMKDAIWVMSEYAGRERAGLGAAITAGRPLTGDQLQQLAENRGRVDAARETIRAIAAKPDTPADITAALNRVENTFFGRFQETRAAVYAASAAEAPYPITGGEWINRSTEAIDTIIALGEVTGAEIESLAASIARASLNAFMFGIAVLVVAGVTVGGAFWLIMARVTGPLLQMRAAMGDLAAGNKDIEVPGLGRVDEIGAMAEAVDVFRKNAIEMERLEAEQAEQERRAEEEKKRTMQELADRFEERVGGVVGAVSSAATELQATAAQLSAAAEETSAQSTAVAAAAEQASANVQTVASATEEMSAAIKEITEQVAATSQKSRAASEGAQGAQGELDALTAAIEQVNDIISAIADVAEQTNLLALNATIEAARAGEAGKGFAVVAAEVKDLANQTKQMTESITEKVTAVQHSSDKAVTATRAIIGQVGEIDEATAGMASAVEQQSAATGEISRNAQEASSGTAEVSANITGVQTAANQTGQATASVREAADDLARQAEMLKSEMANLLNEIRAA